MFPLTRITRDEVLLLVRSKSSHYNCHADDRLGDSTLVLRVQESRLWLLSHREVQVDGSCAKLRIYEV